MASSIMWMKQAAHGALRSNGRSAGRAVGGSGRCQAVAFSWQLKQPQQQQQQTTRTAMAASPYTTSSTSAVTQSFMLAPRSVAAMPANFGVVGGSWRLMSTETAQTTTAAAAQEAFAGSLSPMVIISVTNNGEDGAFSITTPLVSVAGLHRLSLPAEATVADLQAAVAAADASAAPVTLTAACGSVIASSTPLSHFVGERWQMHLGAADSGIDVQCLGTVSQDWPAITDGELQDAYQALRTKLLRTKSKTTTMDEFVTLCRDILVSVDAGMTPEGVARIAQRWKKLLEQEELVVHFASAPDDKLRQTLFVQPSRTRLDLVKALDLGGSALASELAAKQHELDALRAELSEARHQHEAVEKRSKSYVNWVMRATEIAAISQFSAIVYFVYEVSWDVMEPITYFIGVGYSCLFYAFFLRYGSDPTFDNIFDQMYQWRIKKLLARDGIDEGAIAKVEHKIEECISELNIVKHRLQDD